MEIITLGAGEMLYYVFNAIASLTGSGDFKDAINMGLKGAADRESSAHIDDVEEITNVGNVGAYDSFLNLKVTDLDDCLLGDDSGTALERTRAVELLFRPRFDSSHFSIYTSSTDNTLESDERIIYASVQADYNGGTGASGHQNSWLHYCNNLAGYYIGNSSDGKLHYIKSHEISKVDGSTFNHYLKIDNQNFQIYLNYLYCHLQ